MEAYYILGSIGLLCFCFVLSLLMDSIYSSQEIIIRQKPKQKPVANNYEYDDDDDDLIINE